MSEFDPLNPDSQGESTNPSEDSSAFTEQIRHQSLSARVPDHVSAGIFSTGAIVLQGPNEFVMDFLVRLNRPHRVATRVVIPPSVMPHLITAVTENLRRYTEQFGQPQELPKVEPTRRPSIQEVYDELKLPDETMSGCYANAVMVGHSASEFCFDFITTFFPRSAVSSRVYLTVPQVPRLLETLTRSFEQFQQKIAAQRKKLKQQPHDEENGAATPEADDRTEDPEDPSPSAGDDPTPLNS